MNSKVPRQVVIPKEDAVFWMDENGEWHNEHGRFEHPRIIKHFNTSIKKDEQGYFVAQATEQVEEKVYFKYKDTALFIVDIKEDQQILLSLNTGKTIVLEPATLMLKGDSLFINTPDHLIKFTSHALVKLSRYLKEDQDHLTFVHGGKSWPLES